MCRNGALASFLALPLSLELETLVVADVGAV